ncbi:phospho-N-acetylmuramoyl-pentapeptide-transferase [Prochlorothrix hollandica]|uniref:Phospho-N-acetylmuramoyl-pentapeptide-transferase n=1 Tax=Prochlorothrix hollandica PCC 9006 = CALU 1027 TaxID=317619 RepID=A0A0M2PVS4_PROHO|nr:phospho-N-acetylmuramoyl-pentapeptide-transferase [Prochlorothrix hollandica]KKI98466.1 phospho-N-acetylmuramoyl-pentapeptide-transferase [Prochlorothrix hollandica PCC 9006 = CALU 1027]
MDARFSVTRGVFLSGRQLLWGLTGCISAVALILDQWAARSPLQLQSLFLPLVVCTLATSLLGHWAVPLLRQLKAGQFIREDGPQAHLKKAGTPTMGGIFVIPVGLVVALLWSGFALSTVAVSLLTLAYGFIGWLDDWQILRHHSNKGISPLTKLALQVGFGSLFCLWVGWSHGFSTDLTTVQLPWQNWVLPLGFLFWPLAVFTLTAESNATNLTDGLDGLAAGTGAIALVGLGAIVAPNHPDLTLFCAALGGSYLGFLTHNRNPARVFMGDTGSLALGGALAAVAIMSNTLWALLLAGGLFCFESISVVLQVGYYKATKGADGIGKRLFKMAPYHHHLELSGWHETRIVAFFYGITALLSAIAVTVSLT